MTNVSVLGQLVDRVEEVAVLMGRMNIIITSDHGMATIDKKTEVDRYVNPRLYQSFGYSPNWQILPNEGENSSAHCSVG